MFQTMDEAEISIPFGSEKNGYKAWSFCFKRVQAPWLYVITNEELISGGIIPKVYYFTSFDFVEGLLSSNRHVVSEVYLVTPGWINGSNQWRMGRVSKVYQGIEPNLENRQTAEIYEFEDGSRLVDSKLQTLENNLQDIKVIFSQ